MPMSFLAWLWKKWLKIAHIIGNFQAQVILTIFYFVIVSPLGIANRFFGDSLNMKSRKIKSNFGKWDHPNDDLESIHRQF